VASLVVIVAVLMISVTAYGMQAVTQEESNPCIDLIKEAPEEAYRGETITFEYSVLNCGDCTLYDVKVVDAVSGMEMILGEPLDIGEYWNFSDDYTIPDDWPYPKICSIAIAYGWCGDVQVEDWDCECIELKQGQPPAPEVEVYKTAVCEEGSTEKIEQIGVNHTMYWYIQVCNIGNVDLDTWVNDTDLGLDFGWHGTLVAGECQEFWVEYFVDEADAVNDFIENTAFVEAWFGETLLDESDSDSIFLAKPDISVTKQAYCMAGFPIEEITPGHPFYWNITVCNVGNVDLDMVWVNDTQLGFSQMISLAVDECMSFELNDSIPAATTLEVIDVVVTNDYCNLVEVDYFYCHVWFSEEAQDCVFVALPDVEVTKQAYCPAGVPIDEIMVGHGFYWNITVTNTGNVDLESVWVNDTQLGFSQEISLNVGETWSIELDDLVQELPECNPYCNLVEVDYFYCHVWFSEEAQDCVFIADPTVSVVKQAMCIEGEPIGEMLLGHPMFWFIEVTNTGNVDLEGIWVNDTMLNFSEQVSLAPGESTYWKLDYAPCLEDADDQFIIENEVEVAWFYCHVWFSGNATDDIFVVIPEASVEKVALHDFNGDLVVVEEIGLGHEIIWNITVSNDGNVPLEIDVYDEMLGINEVIYLEPGECKYYEVPMVVSESDINTEDDEVCNFVSIEWSYCHAVFTDNDTFCVFVAMPGMEVTKEKLGLPYSAANHTIEWIINVTNTGNVDLMSVDIEDPLTGDMWYGVTIPVGETWSEVVSYLVPANWCEQQECDGVCNVVYVTADVYGNEHAVLVDSAESCVFIHCPSFEIFKTALVDFSAPDHNITWEIAVHNTGNIPIAMFDLWDKPEYGAATAIVMMGDMAGLDLQPDEWRYFYIETTVPADFCMIDADEYFDNFVDSFANVYGEPVNPHCMLYTTAEDLVFIHCPSFEVTKTKLGDFDYSAPGHVIEWEINVTNTGNIPLMNVSVWDTLVGLDEEGIYLDVGESWTTIVNYTVPMNWCEGDCEGVCNVVWASADVYGDEHCVLEDMDESCVFIHCPSFEVTKTKLGEFNYSAPGHVIEWEINVTNTGNIPLMNVSVLDTLVGLDVDGIYLEVGESWTTIVNYTVPMNWCEGDCEGVCNVVWVSADVYDNGHCVLDDTDQNCVFIHCPSFEVVKTALNDYSAAGHMTSWMIEVWNTGNIPLQNVTIVDELLGLEITGIYMDVDGYWSDVFEYTVPEDWCCVEDGDFLCNVVNVSADVYDNGHCYLNASAEDCIFIHCPCVEVTKTKLGDYNYSAPGHNITWEISVYNCGNIPLGYTIVTDTLTQDKVEIYDLGVGEWYNFTVIYEVPSDFCQSECDYVTNVVNVTADVYNNTHCYLYDEAVNAVFIHCPSMEIAKTSLDEFSAANHTTSWLLEVWNTGNIPLENVTVNDPTIGFYQTGIYLPVDGYWSEVVEYVVPADWCCMEMGDYLCNSVYVEADVYDNEHCILNDIAEDCVFIMCPCIDVEKFGPEEMCWGNEVVWTINVTNCGNVNLTCVVVSDPLTGFETVIPVLEVGESMEFETSFFIPYGFCETEWLENEVFAWSWLFGDHCNVSDMATHTVFIAKPDIDLIKTGPETAVRGETIVFEITVVNDGNVPLQDITVTDAYLELEWYVEYLDVGESETFCVEFTIPLCWGCEHFTNWAKADAWYYGTFVPRECFTHDEDCHEVTILEQELTIIKTGPEMAEPGDTITFVINVTNTGEVPLSDVMIWDPFLEMEWCIGELDVGESWEVSVDYFIPFCFEGDGVVNWAFGTGTYHGVTVEAGDGWAVYIYHDPCADPDPTPDQVLD